MFGKVMLNSNFFDSPYQLCGSGFGPPGMKGSSCVSTVVSLGRHIKDFRAFLSPTLPWTFNSLTFIPVRD